MFCGKCGASIPEDAKFCDVCGEAVETPAQEIPEETPIEEIENEEFLADLPIEDEGEDEPLTDEEWAEIFEEETPKKSKKGLWIAIIAVVLVLALAAGAFLLLRPNQFQTYVDDYHALMLDGDLSKLEGLAPKAYWDIIEKQYGLTPAEIVKNETCVKNMQEYVKGSQEYCTKTYGENWAYNVTVLCDHLYNNEATFEDIRSALQQGYALDPNTITEIRALHVESLITGDVREIYDVDNMYALSINGNWYLMDSQGLAVDYMLKNVILSGISVKNQQSTIPSQKEESSSSNSGQVESGENASTPSNDAELDWGEMEEPPTNDAELEWDDEELENPDAPVSNDAEGN